MCANGFENPCAHGHLGHQFATFNDYRLELSIGRKRPIYVAMDSDRVVSGNGGGRRGLRRRILYAVVIVIAFAGAIASSSPPLAGAPQAVSYFRIFTGSTAGTYFPVGQALASVISQPPGSAACEEGGRCGVPGLVAVALASQGSVENVRAVNSGQVESALAQADVVDWAVNGTELFRSEERLRDVRVIANLYRESVHLVVRREAGITSVPDLKGKRVSLDLPNSGTRVDSLIILKAYGVRPEDLEIVSEEAGRAIDMIAEDALDAFFFVGGYPAPAIVDLATTGLVQLVPIDGPAADRLRAEHAYFVSSVIPDDAYDPRIGDVATLSVGAQWIVSADVDDDLVYQITRALWHNGNRAVIEGGHPKGSQIRRETALSGITIPLHAGAVRYYAEADMLGETTSALAPGAATVSPDFTEE